MPRGGNYYSGSEEAAKARPSEIGGSLLMCVSSLRDEIERVLKYLYPNTTELVFVGFSKSEIRPLLSRLCEKVPSISDYNGGTPDQAWSAPDLTKKLLRGALVVTKNDPAWRSRASIELVQKGLGRGVTAAREKPD